MAHAPVPQFTPVHGSKIGFNELPMSSIAQVLQSEPVRRLLNRSNVLLQSPVASGSISCDYEITSSGSRNGRTKGDSTYEKPELSLIPILNPSAEANRVTAVEDKHLLPSKYEGKSAVALVPIRREKRRCGHYEPCENIVCDVNFQQYADENSVSPLIAVNIDASEIDAPVSKHCKSNDCDALSIDHDRCRRLTIRCNRCDLTNVCDICSIVLKTRKSQMNHKNCKMRVEYRHNRTSRGKIMRDRMRQREVQILEAAKIKKYNYEDPVTGHERAIETLNKNSELIVIPKTTVPVNQHSTIRITSVTGAGSTTESSNTDLYGNIFTRFPLVFPQQGIVLGKPIGNNETVKNLSTLNQARIIGTTGTTNVATGSGNIGNSFITVTRMPARNFVKPVDINNLLQTTGQTNVTGTMQSNRFLMPIRVVQTQGIPKYCLVADNTIQSSPVYVKAPSKLLAPRPAPSPKIVTNPRTSETRKNDVKTEQPSKRIKTGNRRGRRRKAGPKKPLKSFECTFCFKKFSTDWYFKMHIAKHKGEVKFTCKYCKKPFMHLYNMTKHVVVMHKKEAREDSSVEENIDENEQSLNCVNCKSSFETRTSMESHPCCILCLRCNARILDGNLMLHLKSKHAMSDEKAVEEYEWQKRKERQSVIAAKNRGRTKRGFKVDDGRRTKTNEEPQQVGNDRENGFTRRKRNATVAGDGQNLRRLTRRRNNSQTEHAEIMSNEKMEIVDREKSLRAVNEVDDVGETNTDAATVPREY